ncbi:hypothetical protein [Hymenobacter weizhouensis]|uniref:hypothetical protein n=1 Tax=Hymenobacter sp. YIM 151500-1 TaxID=2987689 RepID=UPI0022265F26|nr:hypothetical protein [Hymenobacter sp. YIM 151500-1]UYZ62129.1 hypothetical protein OIS53_14075 [Hymenobacter sp. YIM 151500-1]
MLSVSISRRPLSGLLLICGLLALLSSPPAQAQGVHLLSTSKFAPPPAARAFHVGQVLDLRPDRSRLGVVHLGLDNRPVPANFEHPLDETLSGWLRRATPADGSRPVVLRIHALRLEELWGNAEIAAAELVADFLIEREPGNYYFLLPVGELVEQRGLEVTRKHEPNLERVLQQALTQLAALPATAEGTGPALSWADVQAGRGGITTMRYPIQKPPLQRGVYRSFAEFRANAPSGQGEPFTIIRRPRTAKQWAGTDAIDAEYLYLSPDKPRRPVRSNVWGLSDGTMAYFFHRGAFYELRPDSARAAYTFTIPAPATPDDVALGAVLGGLIGAGIAGAISGGDPLPCVLHLASGRIEPQPTPLLAPGSPADSATVYLYRRPDAAPDHSITVLLNGQEVGTLASGSYLRLRWGSRRQDMNVCLRLPAGAEHCHRFVPSFSSPSYLQCSVPTAVDARPTLTMAPEKEGVFYVKKYRLRQR